MKNILIINSSARNEGSNSRQLAAAFVQYWTQCKGDAAFRFRDLGKEAVQHINEDWIIASRKQAAVRSASENAILAQSEAYIQELKLADLIVLAVPMYNWSVPSTLKAYIDQVLRVDETFKVNTTATENPYEGLLQNKTLLLLLSRGLSGYETGAANAAINFQSTYLIHIFNTMGIRDIHQIAMEGTTFSIEQGIAAMHTATHKLQRFVVDQNINHAR